MNTTSYFTDSSSTCTSGHTGTYPVNGSNTYTGTAFCNELDTRINQLTNRISSLEHQMQNAPNVAFEIYLLNQILKETTEIHQQIDQGLVQTSLRNCHQMINAPSTFKTAQSSHKISTSNNPTANAQDIDNLVKAGFYQLGNKNLMVAIGKFNSALMIDPNHRRAFRGHIMGILLTGGFKEAETKLQEIIEKDSNPRAADLILLAIAKLYLGYAKSSKEIIGEAIKIDPKEARDTIKYAEEIRKTYNLPAKIWDNTSS